MKKKSDQDETKTLDADKLKVSGDNNKNYQNIKDSTITDNSVTQSHNGSGNNVVQMIKIGTVNKIVINEQDHPKINDSILFLRVDRDSQHNNRYILKLELKAPEVTETIVEKKDIELDARFFNALQSFEEVRRRRRSGTRRIDYLRDYMDIPSEHQVGEYIYNNFFDGEIGQTFQEFFSLLKKRKIARLTLVVSSDIPEILNLPFELIKKDSFLAFENDGFMVVHTTEKDIGNFTLAAETLPTPLKILFVASLPVSMDDSNKYIDLEKEEEKLIEALDNLIRENKVLVEFIEIASLNEIKKSLSDGQHNILHISGHGGHCQDKQEGVLYLEDEEGNEVKVTGQKLAEALKHFSCLRMVVLSACETARAEVFGVAGCLIKKGIPAVLAMRYPVSDKAATLFTSKFYGKICRGVCIAKSLFYARKGIFDYEQQLTEEDKDVSEWGTPFLYLNQNINFLVDFDKKAENTEYFTRRPQNILEGGILVAQGFVGRHKELIKLTSLFRRGTKAVCLYGLGGLGKTTLAIRFSDNYDNRAYKVIQFIGTVTEKEILEQLAKEASEKLENRIKQLVDHPKLSPVQKLQILIGNYLSQEKIIIIFDNFEDNQPQEEDSDRYEINPPNLRGFLDYFCANLVKNNHIIFTTRYKFSIPQIESHSTGEMSFSDSYKVMNRLQQLNSLLLKDKKAVWMRFGGHPKAFESLDSYLKDEKIEWSVIEGKFIEVEKELDKETNKALLLDMLLGKLTKAQKKILKQAAVLRIPGRVKHLAAILPEDKDEIENSLEHIDSLSLLYYNKTEERFFVYRLTANHLAEKTEEDEKKDLHSKAAEYYLNRPDNEQNDSLEEYQEARFHLIQADEVEKAVDITKQLCKPLRERGFTDLALDLNMELLSCHLSEQDRASVLYNMGIIKLDNNQFEPAQRLFEQVLEIRKILADDDQEIHLSKVANTLNALANIHTVRNNYKDALDMYKESLHIYEILNKKTNGFNSYLCYIADIQGNIGTLYCVTNDFVNANKCLLEALKIRRKLAEDNQEEYLLYVAESLSSLGNLNYYKKNYDEALKYYEEALSISKKEVNNLCSLLPMRAFTLNHIGVCYFHKNNFEEALKKYEDALPIYEKITKDNPDRYLPDMAMLLSNFASAKKKDNDFENAIRYYERSMNIRKQLAKKEPTVYLPMIALLSVNLSTLYNEDIPNKYKAIKYAKKCVEIAILFKQVPRVQEYAKTAQQVLQENGVNVEEFLEGLKKLFSKQTDTTKPQGEGQ